MEKPAETFAPRPNDLEIAGLRISAFDCDSPTATTVVRNPEIRTAQSRLDEVKLWNQALRLYRQQDWDQAELQLYNLTRLSPDCYLYQLYTQRIEFCRTHPPGEGWDGVTNFETK